MTNRGDLRVIYRQPSLPILQNRVYASADEARSCPTGDVVLAEDMTTGLVYNAAFQPKLMVYDEHYQNEQGVSPFFRAHLDHVADLVGRHMGRDGIVEVGCGKGLFLEILLSKNFEITGFDPTYEGCNPRVRREYFGPGLNIQAKSLIMRHVLEHVGSPYDFLCSLRDANGGGGLIYIEVPCFDWICERRAWFDVFYEHVNYFRLSDFHRMFGRVVDSGRIFGGQYLYVIGDLSTLRPPLIDQSDRVSFPEDFSERLDRLSTTKDAAIWGGASKGVIFAILNARRGRSLIGAIDINPVKQGKYLPVSGLLISSPQEAMARLAPETTIYVMNSNYLEEIKAMSNNSYNYVVVDRV